MGHLQEKIGQQINNLQGDKAMFKRGDIVYCETNKQVYVVLGETFNGKLSVRNLTNLESRDDTAISPNLVKNYPQEWANREWYETLGKKFAA